MSFLAEADLKLNLENCFFFRKAVKYLGHGIHSGCIKLWQQGLEKRTVHESLFAGTTKQLKSFLGA